MLLDSEGIDAASGVGRDDNQIFTLIVLLASVLIYNSSGVPTRRDLEGLEYPCYIKLLIVLLLQVLPIIRALCILCFFFLAFKNFYFASRTKILVRDVRLLIAIEQYSISVENGNAWFLLYYCL